MAQIVTITNPITGQPTQVDQLDHTAQQIDDAISRALPGGYYDKWVSQLPGQNLLDNSVFIDGCLVDQRQGRVVIPNTTYYSDNQLTTSAGTTSAYVTAYRYATGTASGVSYASFKIEDSDTAPTYYAAPENVVRGYTGAGYGIDMWKSLYTAPVVLIHDDGIVLQGVNGTNGWGHVIDKNISGMTCTLSVLTETTLYSNTVTIPTSGNYELINKGIGSGWFYGIYRNTNDAGGAVLVRFFAVDSSNASPKIKAVKLELGTEQTLAHQDENGNWVLNEIPDYGEQLARCQRQAEKSCNMGTSVGSPETASPIIKVAYSKWGFCEPMVFFKVPKRTIPAVKIFSAKTGAEGMAYDETAMQDVAVTPSYIGQNSFTVQHASENLVTGHAYQFYYFATAEL